MTTEEWRKPLKEQKIRDEERRKNEEYKRQRKIEWEAQRKAQTRVAQRRAEDQRIADQLSREEQATKQEEENDRAIQQDERRRIAVEKSRRQAEAERNRTQNALWQKLAEGNKQAREEEARRSKTENEMIKVKKGDIRNGRRSAATSTSPKAKKKTVGRAAETAAPPLKIKVNKPRREFDDAYDTTDDDDEESVEPAPKPKYKSNKPTREFDDAYDGEDSTEDDEEENPLASRFKGKQKKRIFNDETKSLRGKEDLELERKRKVEQEEARRKAQEEERLRRGAEIEEKRQQRERRKAQEAARRKAQDAERRRIAVEQTEEQRRQRQQEERRRKVQEDERRRVADANEEKKRKVTVKADEKARRDAQKQARLQSSGDPPVKRIPKLSAIRAIGGLETAELKRKLEVEALETWENNDDRWQIEQYTFDGQSSSETKEEQVIICDEEDMTIYDGIEEFMNNPEKYVAMHYWPENQEQFTYVLRAGTTRYRPKGIRTDGSGRFTIMQHIYTRLEPFNDNLLPIEGRDEHTDRMSHQGRRLVLSDDDYDENKLPILPGRGMGIGDTANMKLIGEYAEPDDVRQGSVGDCWLLSAIACLADFDWAVQRLFRKTKPVLKDRPLDEPNMYTVTLFDVSTWKEVDIVIDERLPVQPDGSGFLLGAKPSRNSKLWVPYLEKAISVHCGGWDKLEGGKCVDAWAMMTGSRNQFTICKNPKTKKYYCVGKYDPYEQKWADHTNSPHDSPQTVWRVDWPKVGGGGDMNLELNTDQLFQKMIAWDENNYLIGAGTDGSSDKETTDGIVDNHAYSVIDSRQDICGTGIDLLLIRNPWGRGGEIENGQFVRFGPGWDKYPDVRDELNPVMEDCGIFWVTKEEFFRYFPTFYVCAFNMTRLQDKNYINDLDDHFIRKKKMNGKKKKKPQPKPVVDEQRIIVVNKKSLPNSPYKIVEKTFDGGVSYSTINKKVIQGTSIAKGVEEFRSNPDKYLAIHYQTSIVTAGWPDKMHQFTYIYRQGTNAIDVDVVQNGQRTILMNILR